MKPRDYIISQIEHRQTDIVPYTFVCEKEVEDNMDKYYGTQDWHKKITPYMSSPIWCDTLQEVKIDNTYAKDGYGSLWRMNKMPWHLEKPVLSKPSFKDYKFPSISQFTDPIYRNIEGAIKKIKDDANSFQLINMGWGIFEQTWRIRGFENALMDSVIEPEFYTELLERITEIYLAMIKACAEVPADAFLFGDDWGDQRGVLLGPDRWRKLIKPCWKKVYDEVHKQGKYVMSHCCGSIADIMEDVIEIGMDVYESVQPEAAGMNTYELKKKWGDKITFWGCLGTQSIVPFGTPEEIEAEIIKLCREVGKGGGFIIAPTKPLQPGTPIENAVKVFETLINKTV
jgi:uroporphyrinogen decarboxylase